MCGLRLEGIKGRVDFFLINCVEIRIIRYDREVKEVVVKFYDVYWFK